jgi:hypothetical protein
MAGPVLHGEHQVSWASRNTDSTSSSRSSFSPATGRGSRHSEDAVSPARVLRRMDQSNFFSPVENRLVEESPMPIITPDMQQTGLGNQAETLTTKATAPDGRNLSAPAELGPARRKFTADMPQAQRSLGTDLIFNHATAAKLMSSGNQNPPDGFELDHEAPIRARRSSEEDEQLGASASLLHVVTEEDERSRGRAEDTDGASKPDATAREGWGESFKIEWLCTDRLPFYRTRHFRNPWNHEREIKVSRDGTELEPTVGQQLLDDWAGLAAEQSGDVDRGAAGAARRPSAVTAPVLGPSAPLVRVLNGGKGGGRRS